MGLAKRSLCQCVHGIGGGRPARVRGLYGRPPPLGDTAAGLFYERRSRPGAREAL